MWTYSNRARSDIDWMSIGRQRGAGAPNTTTPAPESIAGQESRQSSPALSTQELSEADDRSQHSEKSYDSSSTRRLTRSLSPDLESKKPSPRRRTLQEYTAAKNVEDQANLEAIQRSQQQRLQALKSQQTNGGVRAPEEDIIEEEVLDGQVVDSTGNVRMENGQEDYDAFFGEQVADAKREWKEQGRPKCEALLPDGTPCGGYHPWVLHDQEKAVAAQALRNAHALLEKRAPGSLKPAPTKEQLDALKKEKVKKNKEKHKAKRAEKRQKLEEAKKGSSEKGDKPDSKGKGLSNNEVCSTCGKRHKGTCRMCPCGTFHKKETCPTKGIKPANLKDAPQPDKPAWQTQPKGAATTQQQPVAMDRDELLQEASRRVTTPAGRETFIRLMNTGDRPGMPPGKGGR